MRGEAIAVMCFYTFNFSCFVLCECFHRLCISSHASPGTQSVVHSGQFATRASYGAQLGEAHDPLIDCVLACEFLMAINE